MAFYVNKGTFHKSQTKSSKPKKHSSTRYLMNYSAVKGEVLYKARKEKEDK